MTKIQEGPLMLGWDISENLDDIRIDWLLDGWVERGELSLLIGSEGCGKTRLLNALAGFGAIPDAEFEGLSKKKAIKTVIFIPEGSQSIKRHRVALINHYGDGSREHIKNNVHYVNLQNLSVPFELHKESGKLIIEQFLDELKNDHDVDIDLLVLDSISMTTNGEQLNPTIVYPALDNLKTICAARNIGGLVAHHNNRSGRMEGSVMYRRPPVVIREIDGSSQSTLYSIHETKTRDGIPTWKKDYKIEPIKIEDEFVGGVATVCALTPHVEKPKVEKKKKSAGPRSDSNAFKVHDYAQKSSVSEILFDNLEDVVRQAGAIEEGKAFNKTQKDRILGGLQKAHWLIKEDRLLYPGA